MSQLAAKSDDLALKRKSMEKWNTFVDTYEPKNDPKQEITDLLGNAKVYLKQAKSTMYQNDVNF